jgi:hypothetical protein
MKRGVDKRAVTNLEMVVAIVIFVFTIFSMVMLFNVFHKPSIQGNSLDEFEQRFLDRAGNYTLVEAYCYSQAHYIYTFSFETSTFSDGKCNPLNAVYSLPTSGKIFSFNQLGEINSDYYSDYDALKNEFGSDFVLSIKKEDGINMFSMTRAKPSNSEIHAKNFRIKVYDGSGIINAMVNVQIW